MDTNHIQTYHADGERLEGELLEKQLGYFKEKLLLTQVFDSSNVMTLILNKYRQCVFANKAFLKIFNLEYDSEVLGRRPGEILNCIHASTNISGCGTSLACRNCKAVNIMLQSMTVNEEASGEASITRNFEGFYKAINIMERVAPLVVQGETFYVASFIDASDTVRRRSLERIFFHDVINTAGALKGVLGLIREETPEHIKDDIKLVDYLAENLLEEILSQKQLLAAENDELAVDVKCINSIETLNSVANLYKRHEEAINKVIIIDEQSISIDLFSDEVLLKRVLGNMIKNALEASKEHEAVMLGCKKVGNKLEFWVNNSSTIPNEIQYHIFQNSFSSKGVGRGIGTYSMKLIGEKYLKGFVGFTSNEEQGTTFYISLPIVME